TFANTSPYNPAVAGDKCIGTAVKAADGYDSLSTNYAKTGQSYAFALDRSVIFRIDKTNAKTPRLMAWYAAAPGQIPSFYPEAQPSWQTLTENIEDLQIASVLANGVVCGTLGYSTDDATPGIGPCQPVNVRAIRFTLV